MCRLSRNSWRLNLLYRDNFTFCIKNFLRNMQMESRFRNLIPVTSIISGNSFITIHTQRLSSWLNVSRQGNRQHSNILTLNYTALVLNWCSFNIWMRECCIFPDHFTNKYRNATSYRRLHCIVCNITDLAEDSGIDNVNLLAVHVICTENKVSNTVDWLFTAPVSLWNHVSAYRIHST
jgi:hypothetical protein